MSPGRHRRDSAVTGRPSVESVATRHTGLTIDGAQATAAWRVKHAPAGAPTQVDPS